MGLGLRVLLLTLPLAGCAAADPSPGPVTLSAPAAANWRVVATAEDRKRIGQWRTAFTQALGQARAAGHSAEIATEGALLDPDAALAGVEIPKGDYRCRVIKLGAARAGMGAFTRYPAFACRVEDEGEVSSFAKMSGSQRPVGLIFDNDTQRQIFLGTMMLGDERRAIDYGRDADRDMAGAIERIGPARWRMILPYPRFESVMDVIELVPVSAA
ncbi:DUF4893 domain-containing protein [Sphingomonas cavernae]|uniref:DUF4893 domain-containing protein n=1 Tax=Sphingomonas cavernae TaxID=2320861 RepID=A0A418WQL2_9SPHN|nr:DUF4893 domain-containing protein [Sphingomonas cavernae]RJF93486.1 DUF4893 domain-containing protein [Sphingomonas cavernae]